MARYFLLLALILTITQLTKAQTIIGKISDTTGEAIPFATIFAPGISIGTTSNSNGEYKLKIREGKQTLLFQCIGYQTQSIEINIGKEQKKIDIRLATQHYQIPEIKVLASGEDPAYYIMRRAIALAPYYQKQVSKYSCKVYLKGTGMAGKIPSIFKKQMKKSGLKEDEPIVVETVSLIDFELPNQLKQKVLATRTSRSGDDNSPMPMIINNLYQTENYGAVSPLGKNAFQTYRFRLDGVFTDQGRTINKIRVIPKTKSDDVFSGNIFIADDYWNIHSADLQINNKMANMRIRQFYAEVAKNIWMPVSYDFDMDMAGLGFEINFKYVASISEYKTVPNPALDHNFFERLNPQSNEQKTGNSTAENNTTDSRKTKNPAQISLTDSKAMTSNRKTIKLNKQIDSEIRRSDPSESLEIKSAIVSSPKEANNDPTYWESLRPIPLTGAEANSFVTKDSLSLAEARPGYQDSLRRENLKYRPKHFIFGKTFDFSNKTTGKNSRLWLPGLSTPGTSSFNSVDGLRFELPFSYFNADTTGHLLRINPTLAYAFARKKIDAAISTKYRINGLTNSWLSSEIGTITTDYNGNSAMSVMDNDFYTLWREENYKRFYRRDYLQLEAKHDLANGLNMTIIANYNSNSKLSNHSSYSFIDYKDKQILPNVPDCKLLTDEQLDDHQSLTGQIVMEYTPRYRYRVHNKVKQYAYSKYPTFSASYKQAFAGIVGSDSRYSLITTKIKQYIDLGIDGSFEYSVEAGKFLDTNKMYFEDFRHFRTLPTGFSFSNNDHIFRLLPLYQQSTNSYFIESHANWQMRRLILKRLPLIKNSIITEHLSFNYLNTAQFKNYTEVGYGISNLFLVLNVEAIAGFENGKFNSAGLKVSLNLKTDDQGGHSISVGK